MLYLNSNGGNESIEECVHCRTIIQDINQIYIKFTENTATLVNGLLKHVHLSQTSVYVAPVAEVVCEYEHEWTRTVIELLELKLRTIKCHKSVNYIRIRVV